MKTLKKTTHPYLEEMRQNAKTRFYLVAGGAVLFILLLGFVAPKALPMALVFLALSLVIGYRRYLHSAEAGIKGEQAVTKTLQALDDSYYLIDDIQLPGKRSNIDHIVLSPKGIFCIETKNWSGHIRCNGNYWSRRGNRRTYHVESVSWQAWRNARELGNLIKYNLHTFVPVMPICVFTNPSAQLELNKPTLPILRLPNLNAYILNTQSKVHLSEKQILSIAKAIIPQRERLENVRLMSRRNDIVIKS